MAAVQLTPGAHTLTVPITMLPASQSGSAYVYLSSDAGGATVVSTGGTQSFTSTGAAQNVALPITVPSGGGSYYVWVVVYENGIGIGAFAQTNTVIVGGVTVGQGAWS